MEPLQSSPFVEVPNKVKTKRRTMTLVNPADPEEFSNDSISMSTSQTDVERRRREITPTGPDVILHSSLLRVGDSGVKGILRSAGTPGSGNGVRFFPKNRFRVITPREEIGGPSTPQKQPAAPAPAPTSFFSQLLSVVPVMSPRRAPVIIAPPEPIEPDESWERPGEEGEISLVASSVVSAERSTVLGEYDDEEGENEGASLDVPWTGPAEVHSSPLFIPVEGNSKDISVQDIQAPEISMDRWKMGLRGQEDVSNLLLTSLPECGETSFSIGSMTGPTFLPPRISPPRAEDISGVSWMRADQSSMLSVLTEEDNPTIRRRLSPVPSPPPEDVISPAPSRPKAYTYIFADMSAEQAELSWPLTRSSLTAPIQADETTFHSFLPSSPVRVSTSPTSEPPISRLAKTPGNETEFFDASSFLAGTPCPKTSLPSSALTSMRPSAYTGSLGRNMRLGLLADPTKNLFEAQRSHTEAITSELAMYRQLAQKLGKEVEERDKALAGMNMRMIESEMRATASYQSQRQSLSPSPTPSPLAVKSVQAVKKEAESEMRDMEIRLQKALADNRDLSDEVGQTRAAQMVWEEERVHMEDEMRRMEDRERDVLVGQTRQDDAQISELQGQLDDKDLKLNDLRAERKADQDEIERLSLMADHLRDARRREEQLRNMLESIQRETEELKRERVEVERELEGERRANNDMEIMVRELKTALYEAQSSLAESTAMAQRDQAALIAIEKEVNRLRADSSSKDLDILNLQRRKNELKEDREMLNVALDSKQQEVELLKRKLARNNHATPLAASHRQNLGTTNVAQTPMPTQAKYKLHPTTALPPADRARRSSATYATPLQANGRTMRSGAVLMEDQRTSTVTKDRVMRRAPDSGENVPPRGERRESRRDSVMA